MANLYPIKFEPIIKERVWGGHNLGKYFNKTITSTKPVGESWELSGVQEDISVISNGFLKGNDINEIVETYLGDIVGDEIYERYGNEFPILIKLLDIQDRLSVQVHPDDQTAMERHDSYGKTEFWYILDAEPTAKIYMGFNRDTTAQEVYEKCNNDTVEELLNVITPKKGDYFFIEPGTIHAATGGILVAEIQQVSDITYRVYDWGREHNPETARETHLDLAIDCMNYAKFNIPDGKKREGELVDCDYFKINLMDISAPKRLFSHDYKSFVIYICTEGEVKIITDKTTEKLAKGETILIPSSLGAYKIEDCTSGCKLLEITGK